MIDYGVYLVTDAPGRYAGELVDQVMAALEGGVTVVQYRPTAGDRRTQFETARELRERLRSRHVPLVVNDQVDLALAVDADGVHVGQNDLPVEIVRQLVGPHRIVGLSITAPEQLSAVPPVVDYLGVGPVFPTPTKPDAAPALGLDRLRSMVAQTKLPVVAIGGIDAHNAPDVFATGVAGIAVVSAFSRTTNPAVIARELRAASANRRFGS